MQNKAASIHFYRASMKSNIKAIKYVHLQKLMCRSIKRFTPPH